MAANDNRYACPSCKKALDWQATHKGRRVNCKHCRHRHTVPQAPQTTPANRSAPPAAARESQPTMAVGTVPGATPSKSGPGPGTNHLVGEYFDPTTRRRLLLRLQGAYECGIRDPELLYLGARYAASLGRSKLAEQFIEPLATLLRDKGEPTPAYFPVGLVHSYVLSAGEKRDKVIAELRALATQRPHLAQTLRVAGCDADTPQLAGSP
ncbi:MAG: hypothetical protein ABI614_09240 [Planctomycetota bacterium]